MIDEPLGFHAKAPMSFWNQRLGVDYPGVFKALFKAVLAATTANAPGAISAAIDGLFAFRLQEKELTPAELSWLLIRRALARAMARLTVEAPQRHEITPDKDDLIATLDQGLDDAEIWIDPAFLDRPLDHPIVARLKEPFREWLQRLGLNDAEAASMGRRLGAYFTLALHREWAEHSDTYLPIDVEIRKFETPFAKADANERAWVRNAAYLERQIHKPVFDESFGLAEIYVPLRASCWAKITEASDEGVLEREARIVVDLDRYLSDWLNQSNKKDAIRVICGGPGCGKTSFAKIWAARLAREACRVLFVPLHRLDLRDERPDAQTALWEFLRDLRILPNDPLDSRDGERRLLILFDGLDELAMQGRAGLELARNFVEAVERKVERFNELEDRFVQIVFGGRDLAVQSARLPIHQVLNVLPYHKTKGEQNFLKDSDKLFIAHRTLDDPEELLENHNYGCARWWRQFGNAVGEEYLAVPKALQSEELSEITAQPLLNYLLALSYRRGVLDFSSAPNLNLIYEDLLNAIYERRWGPGQHPVKRQLSVGEFHNLLNELGLAAWHGAGRTIAEAQVEKACERVGLNEQLAAFAEGARAGAISLLAAFYFRQAGKIQGERTFEFTHKSFGEYLTARRIVRWIDDIHEERARNRENRQRGLSIDDALLKCVELAGPSQLDHDLLLFLRREVKIADFGDAFAWQKSFVELFSDQLRHGLPMHRLQLPNFQEMQRQSRNCEETMLAIISCCSSVTGEKSQIIWPSLTSLGELVKRVHGQRPGPQNLTVMKCLDQIDAQAQALDICDLWKANLAGVDVSYARLNYATLLIADLSGANLEHAHLEGANLAGTELIGTNLKSAFLGRADLRRANLEGANLEGANLIRVRALDMARGLEDVKSWSGAVISREWVERLNLDSEKLKLKVVDDPAGAMEDDELPTVPTID